VFEEQGFIGVPQERFVRLDGCGASALPPRSFAKLYTTEAPLLGELPCTIPLAFPAPGEAL
jgi:hypothetical protein